MQLSCCSKIPQLFSRLGKIKNRLTYKTLHCIDIFDSLFFDWNCKSIYDCIVFVQGTTSINITAYRVMQDHPYLINEIRNNLDDNVTLYVGAYNFGDSDIKLRVGTILSFYTPPETTTIETMTTVASTTSETTDVQTSQAVIGEGTPQAMYDDATSRNFLNITATLSSSSLIAVANEASQNIAVLSTSGTNFDSLSNDTNVSVVNERTPNIAVLDSFSSTSETKSGSVSNSLSNVTNVSFTVHYFSGFNCTFAT